MRHINHLLLLYRLIDEEGCPQRCLLCNLQRYWPRSPNITSTAYLLSFDGVREFWRERDMCDRHIIQDQVKAHRAICQVLSDETRHLENK